jgi:hypothetical protein
MLGFYWHEITIVLPIKYHSGLYSDNISCFLEAIDISLKWKASQVKLVLKMLTSILGN